MTQFDSHNRTTKSRAVLAALLASLLWLLATPAATAKEDPNEKPPATTKKRSVNKITHQRSTSEESRAERDRRLYRECKGLPNAGACLGYARGR